MASKNSSAPSLDREGLVLSVVFLILWIGVGFTLTLIDGRIFSLAAKGIFFLTPLVIIVGANLTFGWTPVEFIERLWVKILIIIAIKRMKNLILIFTVGMTIVGCTMLWKNIPHGRPVMVGLDLAPPKVEKPKAQPQPQRVEIPAKVETSAFDAWTPPKEAQQMKQKTKKVSASRQWVERYAKKLPMDRPAIPGKDYVVENLTFMEKFAITVRACDAHKKLFGDVIGCTVTMLKTCYRESSCQQASFNQEILSYDGKFGSHSYFAIRTKLHDLGSCDANGKISMADTYRYRKALEWTLNNIACTTGGKKNEISKRSLYAHNGATTLEAKRRYDQGLVFAEKKLNKQFSEAITEAGSINKKWLVMALNRLKGQTN